MHKSKFSQLPNMPAMSIKPEALFRAEVAQVLYGVRSLEVRYGFAARYFVYRYTSLCLWFTLSICFVSFQYFQCCQFYDSFIAVFNNLGISNTVKYLVTY